VRDQGWERGGAKGEEKMAYFERKRKTILALSGLTTNKKARDLVLRIIIEYNRPNPFT
jgi:predicted DNA-binding WGR domain protein